MSARTQQAFQFRHRAHLASQRAHRIFIELGVVELSSLAHPRKRHGQEITTWVSCVISYVPEAGDIVMMDFDPRIGHQQAKRRPALVLSDRRYSRASGLAGSALRQA